jgi:hypothetical protein
VWVLLQVTLVPAHTVSVEPHAEHDPQEFASITHLANRIDSHGYYGGVRLLLVRLTEHNTYSMSKRCSTLPSVPL